MEGRWRILELESMTEEHSCATFISVACACSSAVLVCACRVVRGWMPIYGLTKKANCPHKRSLFTCQLGRLLTVELLSDHLGV